MVRVALLSSWHVHSHEYAQAIADHPNAALIAVWDEDEQRGREWADAMDIPFEPNLDTLLARDDIDAVSVCAPTNMHEDVMVRCANAGKHIFTEKVLAATNDDALRIRHAVVSSGVRFCISFPRRSLPQVLYAKQALADGLFGDITALRIRVAHDGASGNWLPERFYDPAACCGGAMMDLGAHGMYIARWLLGRPRRVVSVFNHITGRRVEDNTVSVIEFESGAIAVNETSFVSHTGAFSLEIDGTRGGYRMAHPDEPVRVCSETTDQDGPTWYTPESLPPPGTMPIDQWITAIETGAPIEFGIDEAVQLTELMHAAYAAHASAACVEICPGTMRHENAPSGPSSRGDAQLYRKAITITKVS